MNYSVFKLQNQGGKPSIFWEKDPSGFPTKPLFQPNLESVPKKDKKTSYKTKRNRFPVRKFPTDNHHVESDLVTLTPDEPPPKPAKNFIRRNKDKLVAAKQKETGGTVTLTQEQLNAILKSVGKVAGGSENAVKISIGENSKEITIESPRHRNHRDDDDDDVEDEREKRRSKKKQEPKEDGASIYSFLNGGSKTKASSDSEGDNVSEKSVEVVTKSRRRRQERKPRRDYNNDDEEDDNRNNKNRKSKPRKKYDDDDDDELKIRRDHSRPRKYDDDDDDDYYERNKKETKTRKNKSKSRYDEDEDNDNVKENRRRKNQSRRRDDSDDDDDDDNRDNDTRERVRKSDKDRNRKSRKDDHSKDRSGERDTLNDSETNNPEEVPSPRDKIGLPNDLSWRHMTKAERRRLEMARQKFLDDDERKEGERKQNISMQLGMAERRIPPRSDPATRIEPRRHHGRETDTSNLTEGFRRDRRSRSPEDNRSRTPDRLSDMLSHQSPDTSPKHPLALPRQHMTLAEKKRLEWERDRVESSQFQKTTEPWGRPGAGAPLRSRSGNVVADYKGRQENLRNSQAIQEEGQEDVRSSVIQEDRVPHGDTRQRHDHQLSRMSQAVEDTAKVPHAMRSSFVFGNAAPGLDMHSTSKEKEKKQWLADLEKQIEEKRMKEMKNTEVREEDTWASKLGTHRPLPFPAQPKDTVSATGGDFMGTLNHGSGMLDTQRVASAPNDMDSDLKSNIRGQNVPIDPVTKKELEDKRQKYLDHQTAIKAQVEEKERVKRAERDRKVKEDMEEERKLQMDRETLQLQFDSEQTKQRQKEAQRQAQVNQLKAAMDEAQAQALQEKYQRRMEHLEAGGHDTTKLREHLEGEITGRIEQLNTRRERDIQKAQKLLELRHWGLKPLEESISEPLKTNTAEPSKTGGAAKITPRGEEKVYGILNEPAHIPGLDLGTARTVHHQQTAQDITTRSKHEPYTSNRVLTPSQFRHLSKPWSDPSSPRREFATQTGNHSDSPTELDDDDVNKVLNQSLSRDDSDINIEYRGERERRVRVISAPKETLEKRKRQPQPKSQPGGPKSPRSAPPSQSYREQLSPHQHHHEARQLKEQEEEQKRQRATKRGHGPVKPGSRPKWGCKNPDKSKPQKQSEKDPFYEQKKRESERRRMKREQQLLAMVEKNKDIIPEYYVPSERATRSRDPSPFSDFGGETPREIRVARRSKSHSPNRFNSTTHSDVLPVHRDTRQQKQGKSPVRERSPSPERSRSPASHSEGQRPRGRSPPVPALKHRHEAYNESQPSRKKGGKYKDVDPLSIPVQNGEFIPFTRTIDVLDPAKAEEPMPLSREATRVANARKTYYESLNPEKFGNRQLMYQDKDRVPRGPEDFKNPLFNPSLVTDYPTNRQDQILMQLSTLKQSLMQRQRELETFSPTDLEKQASIL